MIVAITGASGLIGSALVSMFERRGDEVRPLVRREARAPREISWNPATGAIDAGRLEGVDAVINLAGENLAQRWSDDVKHRIRESRVGGTTILARAIASLATKPRVLLSGSAIGIYGSDRGDELLEETSSLGSDFLAEVCKAWEAAASPVRDAGVRLVALRTGLVLSPDGGLLPKFLLPFKLGVGGPLGDGTQWMSWIGLGDYTRAIAWLIEHETLEGPVNITSPNPVTNNEFSEALSRVLKRPDIFRVPKFALNLAMGEMAEQTALASQRVAPKRLLDSGFEFRESEVLGALEAALRP